MSNETEFVDGLIAKAPRAGAPDFIKASLAIKREELIAWLVGRDGEWINVDIKESKGGKYYAAVDSWKPDPDAKREDKPQQRQDRSARRGGGGGSTPIPPADDFGDPDIPFVSMFGTF